MRVTVLGKSPSWCDAGGACSGYLVQSGDTNLLLDCGNGVFGKLRLYRDYVDVDAVVISHLHADHILDLVPYAYGLTYAPRQQPVPVAGWPGTQSPARPRLIAPRGAAEAFRRLTSLWANDRLIEDAFELEEYGPDDVVEVGELTLSFREVPHFLSTFAIDVRDAGGRLTYGADCSPTEELVRFARDTDLLLVEATLPRPERTGTRGHLTPSEAGEHARQARARRVVLIHISDELDPAWAAQEASEAFAAQVEVAREGDVYVVGSS